MTSIQAEPSGKRASGEGRELAASLLAAFGALMARRGRFGANPSRHAEHRLLWILLEDAELGGNGLRVVDLCERLGVRPPTVTRAVDALELRGLVSRAGDLADRRSIRVRLSPAGLECARSARERALDQMEGLAERLGAEDAATLATLLLRSSEYFTEACGTCPRGKGTTSC
ncbi:MAG: MarR family transcriptional regulator [Spirochaetales bacterium]|nr:MarR family transcriptional regulator [Spirochaetales bacterium]